VSVTIHDKPLSLICVLDPEEPFDIPLIPFPNPKKYYDDAIAFLSKSPKAVGFIKQIVESAHEFKVMVTDRYPNKYWSPNELATMYKTKLGEGASLITWNSKENGQWFAIEEHRPPDIDVPDTHPSVQNNSVPVAAILLIHEFGHGLQYLANKTEYEALRTASYVPGTGKDVDTRIENENVLKHEAPVCLELGQQVRWQYWDMERPKPKPKPRQPVVPKQPIVPKPELRGFGDRTPQPYSGLGVGRKESIR
jgi:hypothetical protein